MNYGLQVMGNARHKAPLMALVQSIDGGHGAGTTTATTTAVGFASQTTAGSLLVCVVWGSGTLSNPTISTPSTSGFTWTQAAAKVGSDLGCSIFYIPDASSMATSKTTTVSITGTGTVQVEFSLYEFSGLTFAASVDTTETNTGTSSTPSTPNLSTSATDLILCAAMGTSGPGTTKVGYTSGIAAQYINYGVGEYILNQASGSIATGFGGSQSSWVCVAVAFQP